MPDEKPLIEVINEYLASNTLEVPVFHTVALRLQQVLANSDFNIAQVITLIVADQALASKVLRVANSSFYAGLNKVANIKDAVVRLGAQEVANIAMLATQQDLHQTSNENLNHHLHSIWQHALGCAIGAKWLAEKIGYGTLAQEAFLAGLLHDIGNLFLLKVINEISGTREYALTFTPALITEVLESMHVEQGFQLMEKWNLPAIYADVVRFHHDEDWNHGNVLLTMVRLVDRVCYKLGIGMYSEEGLDLYSVPEVQVLGVKEIVLAELEIAIEDALQVTL